MKNWLKQLSTLKAIISVTVAKATRQLDKPQFKHNKHRLAQLLSVEHERKRRQQQPSWLPLQKKVIMAIKERVGLVSDKKWTKRW